MFETLVATSIAAVTELVKRAEQKDYRGVVVILTAAIIGGLASIFPEIPYTPIEGIIAGLGIVGIHTIARQVG